MNKILFSISLFLIMFFVFFAFLSKPVWADGMMISKPNPYSDRWDYSNEIDQEAFINYENGLEKMIISVRADGTSNSGVVWLFPIPSDPNKISIDVVKSLPTFEGEEISKKAKSNLGGISRLLRLTQIYTIPYDIFLEFSGVDVFELEIPGEAGGLRGSRNNLLEQDVIVYKHLEKEGVVSEIITAKTAAGIYNYFQSKGLKIEIGSIPVLDNYIGKEYSFVASWINSPKYGVSTQRGLFVSFPTKNIYFPMLPTSVYGNKTIPITIRVMGHVSPIIFHDIKDYTKTQYYIEDHSYDDSLKNFYSDQGLDIKYTKIEINAPSTLFTEDLWIKNSTPLKTHYSTFVAKHPMITMLLLLITSSLIAGISMGWMVFKELRKNFFKLSLIGLSNCFTILGLIITTELVVRKGKDKSIQLILIFNELKQKGYIWKRRLSLFLFFSAIPTGIFFLIISLFIIPHTTNIIRFFFAAIVPLMLFIVSFVIKKVKIQDKNLFDQLKTAGYSSWTFKSHDKRKLIFIPIFSIHYLIISWLLVKLIELTV